MSDREHGALIEAALTSTAIAIPRGVWRLLRRGGT